MLRTAARRAAVLLYEPVFFTSTATQFATGYDNKIRANSISTSNPTMPDEQKQQSGGSSQSQGSQSQSSQSQGSQSSSSDNIQVPKPAAGAATGAVIGSVAGPIGAVVG